MPKEVGIRELRQNLSAVLARVQTGERLIVTSHNRPIAELVPLDEDADPLQRLIDRGSVTKGREPFGDFEPLPNPEGGRPLTEALEYMRGHR